MEWRPPRLRPDEIKARVSPEAARPATPDRLSSNRVGIPPRVSGLVLAFEGCREHRALRSGARRSSGAVTHLARRDDAFRIERRRVGARAKRRRAADAFSAAPVRTGPLRVAPDLPGHGRGRPRLGDQARHVGRQSGGHRSPFVQAAVAGGGTPRFPVAHRARAAGARPHRYLQSVVLRRSARGPRASAAACGREPAAGSDSQECLVSPLRGYQRVRAPSVAQRNDHPQVLPARVASRTVAAVAGPARRPGEELEVLASRCRRAREVARVPARVRRRDRCDEPSARAVVGRPGRSQVVHGGDRRRRLWTRSNNSISRFRNSTPRNGGISASRDGVSFVNDRPGG